MTVMLAHTDLILLSTLVYGAVYHNMGNESYRFTSKTKGIFHKQSCADNFHFDE